MIIRYLQNSQKRKKSVVIEFETLPSSNEGEKFELCTKFDFLKLLTLAHELFSSENPLDLMTVTIINIDGEKQRVDDVKHSRKTPEKENFSFCQSVHPFFLSFSSSLSFSYSICFVIDFKSPFFHNFSLKQKNELTHERNNNNIGTKLPTTSDIDLI